MKPTAAALAKEGKPFCGILYGGLMLTRQGPKVIEFNARFGDPETEVVLVRLKSDLLQMILDILDHKPVAVQYEDHACLGVVMAAEGYPGSYPKGLPIGGLETVPNMVFHMGTKRENDRWLSNGGRVLCVVGQGGTLAEAQGNAYDAVARISAEGLFYRKDIGWQAV